MTTMEEKEIEGKPGFHPFETEGYREIPIVAIIPTPHNKRRIHKDDPKIAELAISIREKGVLQPVVVRPHPKKPLFFELLCGQRRWTAAGIAGLEVIPAMVRLLDDQAAIEVTALENLQREDLSPMEEAEQVALLLSGGYDAESAARAIGRSKQWVYTRAHIAKLTPEWKDAIAEPQKDEQWGGRVSGFCHWNAGLLEEVARTPEDIQGRILKYYKEMFSGIPTLSDVRARVASFTRELGKAPFDIEDPGLVRGVGSCTDCPHRQGAQPDLFGMTEVVPVEKDICMNAPCYAKKVIAHGRAVLREKKDENPETIEVKRLQSGGVYDGGYISGVQFSGADGYYEKTKKSDPDAVPAVVTGAQGRGETVYVKKKAEKKRAGNTIGQLKEALELERKKEAMTLLRAQIEATAHGDLLQRGDFDVWKLVQAALIFDISPSRLDLGDTLKKRIKTISEVGSGIELCVLLWQAIQERLPSHLSTWNPDIAEAKVICSYFGLSWKPIWDQALVLHPDPGEWAGLSDDDIPKKR